MFYECNSLTNIDLFNINTQNVDDMTDIFYGCNSFPYTNLYIYLLIISMKSFHN